MKDIWEGRRGADTVVGGEKRGRCGTREREEPCGIKEREEGEISDGGEKRMRHETVTNEPLLVTFQNLTVTNKPLFVTFQNL